MLNHPVSIVSGNDVGRSLGDRQIVEESTDRGQQKREGHHGAPGGAVADYVSTNSYLPLLKNSSCNVNE